MPRGETYDVSSGDDRWEVKACGARRASNHFDTKTEAVQWGRDLVKRQEGRLVIRKQDVVIQEERHLPRRPLSAHRISGPARDLEQSKLH
jgi:hypothetical protein